MKNLNQIRAHNALQQKEGIAAGQGGGDVISDFPMLILTDGLLAALAFSCQWRNQPNGPRKHPGHFTVARAIADHLSCAANPVFPSTSPDDLLAQLAALESDAPLRRATAEALAFLSYLKRFVA